MYVTTKIVEHFNVSVSTFLLTHAGLTVDIHVQELASKSTADSSEYTTESSRKIIVMHVMRIDCALHKYSGFL